MKELYRIYKNEFCVINLIGNKVDDYMAQIVNDGIFEYDSCDEYKKSSNW